MTLKTLIMDILDMSFSERVVTPEEKKIAKAVLESLILKHDANRFSATG